MPIDLRAVTQMFFDRQEVRAALDRGTRKALSKFGAFVRQRARTSIRKRKRISEPFNPPSSHRGDLRRLIFFAFDKATNSVVIGPVPFGKGEAPALLEHGGTTTRVDKGGHLRTLFYRPRPYMWPAWQAEMPRIPQVFKDAIH